MKKNVDNKTFWKTVRTFFSDKPPSDEKINLLEKNKVVKADTTAVNVLNTFFSTIIRNLSIHEYSVSDSICNDINNPALKSILRYKDNPSIKAFENISRLNWLFKFFNVEKGEILMKLLI